MQCIKPNNARWPKQSIALLGIPLEARRTRQWDPHQQMDQTMVLHKTRQLLILLQNRPGKSSPLAPARITTKPFFQDTQPVGAMMLINYDITRCDDTEPGAPPRAFRICLKKQGIPTLHLAADSDAAAQRWQAVLTSAAERSKLADTWLEQTKRNLSLTPANMYRPDCFGYLNKLGTKWKTWTRRYCVLKDACLYFYQDANSKCSFGKTGGGN